MSSSRPVIRPYLPADERGWLLCRLMSFFDTCYYDNVQTVRTAFTLPSVQLVADLDGHVVGLIDVEIDGTAATIDNIAVHPDHQRTGVGSLLLAAASRGLPADVTTLDAWTREDPSALGWYRHHGFHPGYRYLHVYKTGEESEADFGTPLRLSAPVIAFCHAPLEDEVEIRSRFQRVYVCTQFLRPVGAELPG